MIQLLVLNVVKTRMNSDENDHTKTEKLINNKPLSNRFTEISEVNFCLNLFWITNQIESNKNPPIKEINNSVIK